MENPGLQEVRDACADLVRGGEEDDTEPEDANDDKPDEKQVKGCLFAPTWRCPNGLPQLWIPKLDKQEQKPASIDVKFLMEASVDLKVHSLTLNRLKTRPSTAAKW